MKKRLRSSISEEDGVDNDMISELPEPILHNILSLLPTKDSTKTCILSRTWNNVWNSFPILDFDIYSFQKSSPKTNMAKVLREFCHYVDNCISRPSSVTSIGKFKIVVYFGSRGIAARWKDLDRWLNYAISKNVENLVLHHHIRSREKDGCHYVLPTSLFGAKSLKMLDLFGCQFVVSSSCISIGLYLKKLHLVHVCIDEKTLENLVSGCSLEDLHIYSCIGFQTVKLVCPKLKKLDLYLARDETPHIVAIEAPNVRFLSYGGGDSSLKSSFMVSKFKNVTELILHDVEISGLVSLVIHEFRLLEKLELIRCSTGEDISCFLEYLKCEGSDIYKRPETLKNVFANL